MPGNRLTWCLCCALMVAGPAWAADGFSTSTSSASLLEGGQKLSTGQFDSAPNRFANIRFEAHLGFGWYGAVGIGGRLEFPIVRAGILQNVDDEIALSIGAEVFYFYGRYLGVGVTPLIALQWNFFLSNAVSIFPELGLAFIFGPGRDAYWGTFIAPYLGLGIRFHFTDRNAVLIRGSWPAGLQVGITF